MLIRRLPALAKNAFFKCATRSPSSLDARPLFSAENLRLLIGLGAVGPFLIDWYSPLRLLVGLDAVGPLRLVDWRSLLHLLFDLGTLLVHSSSNCARHCTSSPINVRSYASSSALALSVRSSLTGTRPCSSSSAGTRHYFASSSVLALSVRSSSSTGALLVLHSSSTGSHSCAFSSALNILIIASLISPPPAPDAHPPFSAED